MSQLLPENIGNILGPGPARDVGGGAVLVVLVYSRPGHSCHYSIQSTVHSLLQSTADLVTVNTTALQSTVDLARVATVA